MFEYDPFQKKAIDFIGQNRSLLVSAPTGAGKTCIAEAAIEQAMQEGKGAIYTAPIKALSNQKYRDFREKYGERVGIITGDVTINSQAPLLVMTTEIYRNRLFENVKSISHISWLIFDEIHYIDDPERGTVWEEAIMFSPPHVKFVCLSATVPNIEELAGWMNTVHNRDIHVIIEKDRPVPLSHYFQAQGCIIKSFKMLKKDGYRSVLDWSQHREKKWHRYKKKDKKFKTPKRRLPLIPNRIDHLIKRIDEEDGFPCIYFTFARQRTEYLAQELTRFEFLNRKEEKAVIELFDELCKQYEITEEPSVQNLYRFVKRGIAYHHAGMLPTTKEVVERLFTSRLIKLIFTTETFALGINMPAKTVIFDELQKYDGTGFGNLRTRDYFQMAGRAGRRGMDQAGFVYSRVNPNHISFPAVQKIITSEPEPVVSQFNATYATILNLYRHYQENLIDIYPKSFHAYQGSKRSQKRALDAIHRKMDLLKFAGYIHKGNLSEKGEFASCMYGYELLLTELLAEGVLEHLSVIELVMLLVALVFEPRKKDHEPRYNKDIIRLIDNVHPYMKQIKKLEKNYRVYPPTKRPFFHMAPAIRAWLSGEAFQNLDEFTSSDEGEIVRYFRMVIQLLRILREAPTVSEKLKQNTRDAIRLINRDEIDAEKQLRV